MSWIQKLYETYDNCQSMVGVELAEDQVPLIPVCHTTQKAQVEIVIDGMGNFQRAKVIPKNESRTIIPCTEGSSGRTSGEAPHPLCDKLQYIALDYVNFGGSKKPYTSSYIKQLEKWCSSVHSHHKPIAVLSYVQKGTVIKDLIDNKVFYTDDDGKLLRKWDKKRGDTPPMIFEVLSSTQDESFVRWIVEEIDVLETRVWRDKTLWESWIDYYSSTKDDTDLCYVIGKEQFLTDQHPAKIRNDGDKAKIISSNDNDGFTFRGRFLTSDQAASVGFLTTQKAHLALRWLINRQGFRKGDLAIVAWATSGKQVPQPTDDPLSIIGFDELPSDQLSMISTAQEIAEKLSKKIAGYQQEIGKTGEVVVMAVDSATPGRLSITYYRELTGSDFLQRINNWHSTCAWIHSYTFVKEKDERNGKIKKRNVSFIGAPAPADIAEAAYGVKVDDKLKQATVARILPCIVEGQQIPRDLVQSTVRRACNRVGLDHWEWNKTLSIACALYKKYNWKENFTMALDPNRKTRDYLYGRLLALADSLEEWALNKAGEKRETNAARLMQRFAERPFSTWRTIELALAPSKARLGGKSIKRQKMIDEVICSFKEDDFISDKPLSGEFLLGYHCQREYLRNHPAETAESDENNQ